MDIWSVGTFGVMNRTLLIFIWTGIMGRVMWVPLGRVRGNCEKVILA